MPVKQNEIYKAELYRALEKCQFIEEILKMCLMSAVDIVRIQVQPFFTVSFKLEDISQLPLGPLLKAFEKIHDDKALHADLRSFRKERNELAYRSLLFTIGEAEDKTHMSQQTAKMKAIADHAAELHSRLLDVRLKFVQALNKAKRTRGRDGG